MGDGKQAPVTPSMWPRRPLLALAACACLTHAVWASDAVEPARQLIIRNFGAAAAQSFDLSTNLSKCGTKSPPCFSLSSTDGKRIALGASSISELTYGIGWYTRWEISVRCKGIPV